jgi:hypothetical protein
VIALASTSQGTYRIPYRDGTTVEVPSDHLTHDPPTRIDMKGVGGGTPYRIVAAADGVIRFIRSEVDSTPNKRDSTQEQIIQTRVASRWRTVGFRLVFGREKRKALNGPKSITASTEVEQLESSRPRGG